MQNQASAENIMKVGWGFVSSKILLASVELDLFTVVAKLGKTSAKELKHTLGLKCSDRHFFDLLDSLTAFGFLNRQGILENAQYSNGIDADAFLDKNKDTYIGGFLQMANRRLYEIWGRFQEGLKTGEPQNESRFGGNVFDVLYSNADMLTIFMNAMGDYQNSAFQDLARKFDFSNYKSVVDVGGALGNLSVAIAKENSHVNCSSFDLPAVVPLAQAHIQKHNLSQRVKAVTGDFFKDPLPKADVILMGNILHDWDQKVKEHLIKIAYEALNEGGAFVVVKDLVDDERKAGAPAMAMSLTMLLETRGGFNFAFNEYTEWVKSAGFKKTEVISLVGGKSAAIAYK